MKRLSREDAYRVQLGVLARIRCRGERQAGWKVGLTSKATQAQQGVHEPVLGFLLQSGEQPSGTRFRYADLIPPASRTSSASPSAPPCAAPGSPPSAPPPRSAAMAPAFYLMPRPLRGRSHVSLADNAQQRAYVPPARRRFEDGEWRLAYERCAPDDPAAVEAECRGQLDAFRELFGRDPTHLDSHQHTHMSEPVASVAARLAAELGVPLRDRGIRYEGGFYGQTGKGEPYPEGIEPEHLVELIEALPPGWTELGCHPGRGADTGSPYEAERELELRALCDPRVPRRSSAPGSSCAPSPSCAEAAPPRGGDRLASP